MSGRVNATVKKVNPFKTGLRNSSSGSSSSTNNQSGKNASSAEVSIPIRRTRRSPVPTTQHPQQPSPRALSSVDAAVKQNLIVKIQTWKDKQETVAGQAPATQAATQARRKTIAEQVIQEIEKYPAQPNPEDSLGDVVFEGLLVEPLKIHTDSRGLDISELVNLCLQEPWLEYVDIRSPRLNADFSDYKQLRGIKFEACQNLVINSLPEGLTHLTISVGHGINLSRTAWPQTLTHLTVSNVITTVGSLSHTALQVLDLSNVGGMISLPATPATLTELKLQSCYTLNALPPSDDFPALKKAQIVDCTGLNQIQTEPEIAALKTRLGPSLSFFAPRTWEVFSASTEGAPRRTPTGNQGLSAGK